MHITFEDKVVVITGAVGGLGSAMCRRFGADGARVIVCDLRHGGGCGGVDCGGVLCPWPGI